MSTPFLEHIDVFLPGHDHTLTQAPAYHWERTEERAEISAKEGLDEQPSAPPGEQPQNTSGSLLHTAGLSANLYTNTRDPSTVLVAVTGSDSKQKRQLAQSTFIFDHTNLKYHDFDGFGVHLPGILVTSAGTAIAVCQRRMVDIRMTSSYPEAPMTARPGHGNKSSTPNPTSTPFSELLSKTRCPEQSWSPVGICRLKSSMI